MRKSYALSSSARPDKRPDERRRPLLERRALRLEQRGNVERMSIQFHRPDFVDLVVGGSTQRTGDQEGAELGIQAVAAAVAFRRLRGLGYVPWSSN